TAGPAPSAVLVAPAAAPAARPPAPALPAPAPSALTAAPVTADQVEVDQVAPLNLDPAFVASLNLADGDEVEFGNATDPSRTMAAVQADAAMAAEETSTADTAAPGPVPAPAPGTPGSEPPGAQTAPAEAAAAPGAAEPAADALPADPEAQLQQLMSRPVEGGCAREKSGEPATQAAVPEADRVYGPFTAGQRARYLLHQMRHGIGQWFSCNWPWLLGAVVLGLAAFIVANILSGGAVLAALPALMQLLTVVMVGVALARVALWIGEYLTQGWVGQIAAAARSLARGLAIGAIDLIFALIFDLGAILKAVREGARATMRATVAATRASLTTLRRSGGQIVRAAGRTIRNPGRAARVVAGVTMRRGRIVMRGVRAGFERGVRSLDDLARRLFDRVRFRRFKLRLEGRRIRLYGYINPWILLADGSLQNLPTTGGRPEVGDVYQVGRRRGYLVGVDTAPSQAVAELRNLSPSARRSLYQQFGRGTREDIRRYLMNRESTAQLRRGIPTGQPANFNAHHIVPRELRSNQRLRSFLDEVGFGFEDGARNGVMLPPNPQLAAAYPAWANASLHFTSHPNYTRRVATRLARIADAYEAALASGVPRAQARAQAAAAVDSLTTRLRNALMNGTEALD
ncbi:MAG: AHH domain-containing protein, partial [Gemmatimonadetes bacterium]|nr:AHH domain-containing protein [Gemmatimonadota bacterium]